MLSEVLGSSSGNVELEQLLKEAYARNLCREHGAARVTLSKVTHDLPTIERIIAGGTLDDPRSYSEEPLGTFECEDLLDTQ